MAISTAESKDAMRASLTDIPGSGCSINFVSELERTVTVGSCSTELFIDSVMERNRRSVQLLFHKFFLLESWISQKLGDLVKSLAARRLSFGEKASKLRGGTSITINKHEEDVIMTVDISRLIVNDSSLGLIGNANVSKT
jgi:hypothetical protein